MANEKKYYDVEVLKYPEVVSVEATSEEEAKELATNQVNFSIWQIVGVEER